MRASNVTYSEMILLVDFGIK